MKIGIIGFPQTGKKTLFELITRHNLSENDILSGKPIEGIAEIVDPRFEKLAHMYNPEKLARAKINLVLLPKLGKGDLAKEEVLKEINVVDVLCHVVRSFHNDSVYHLSGSVDPKRDIEEINSELILNDLLFIEKRLERIEKNIKRLMVDSAIKEKELLFKLKQHLEKEKPLRLLEMKSEDKKILSSYPLITFKEMIVVLNVSEKDLKDQSEIKKLETYFAPFKINMMCVSAKVEAEIAVLETEDERQAFLKEVGISEPAIDILKRVCIKALDLISFFGVGSDEVKQWTIRAGSSAPQAAGAIHSDLEKGFIRAEVMKYDDLISFGSEKSLKEAGKFYLKGKDYIVEDGDIIGVRFNV
ncbi:MAG: redox-regulated ATPase YchF [Candidatus Firestonebacteria bacterium]